METNQPTTAQVKAALDVTLALADAIRELGAIPSGKLYVLVMGMMSIESYEKAIALLTSAGLVKNEGNLLTWIGGAK
jgi:hypothetical protein